MGGPILPPSAKTGSLSRCPARTGVPGACGPSDTVACTGRLRRTRPRFPGCSLVQVRHASLHLWGPASSTCLLLLSCALGQLAGCCYPMLGGEWPWRWGSGSRSSGLSLPPRGPLTRRCQRRARACPTTPQRPTACQAEMVGTGRPGVSGSSGSLPPRPPVPGSRTPH